MRDIKQGWYHVYVIGDESKAIVDLDALADALPHGSGIDGDWHITVRRNGDIGIVGEYHNMNEQGYYCGWSSVRASIVRIKKDERHPLFPRCPVHGYFSDYLPEAQKAEHRATCSLPMEQETQLVHWRNQRVLKVQTRGENGDYFYDTLSYALGEFLKMENCKVQAKEQNK